jgi:hypothetical protein
MKEHYMKIDLWVVIACLMLIPKFIEKYIFRFFDSIFISPIIDDGKIIGYVEPSSIMGDGLILNIILLILIMVSFIGYFIYYLTKCGLLVKYRFLFINLKCEHEPKYFNLIFFGIALLIFTIFLTFIFPNIYLLIYILPLILYVLLILLISMQIKM